MEVVKDSDVQLECEVTGTPPFEVTWLKNNREIRSSKKYTLTDRVSVFKLHITRCDPSDTGEYQCIVSNEGGSCASMTRVSLKGQWYPRKAGYHENSVMLFHFLIMRRSSTVPLLFPTISLHHRTPIIH